MQPVRVPAAVSLRIRVERSVGSAGASLIYDSAEAGKKGGHCAHEAGFVGNVEVESSAEVGGWKGERSENVFKRGEEYMNWVGRDGGRERVRAWW